MFSKQLELNAALCYHATNLERSERMKIKDIQTVRINVPPARHQTHGTAP